MDDYFFDPIFNDGAFTEERIDSAGIKIMELVDKQRKTEAKAAVQLLADMLLLAIADGRAKNPQACAAHYFTVTKAALGQPTLLDDMKRRITGQE